MKHNYCLIMSGGIGSRFWPISKKEKPKQFLDFFETGRSLLQQTFDRCKKIVPAKNIFICTNEMYAKRTAEQIPDLVKSRLLLEPIRRNTAPCIVYFSYRIFAEDSKANLLICPSDHLIIDESFFIANIKKGLGFVKKFPYILTIGIKPSRPEIEYGYIQTITNNDYDFQQVKTFTEKPNEELAKIFYECNDFFWNSGIFLCNIKTILQSIKTHLPEMNSLFSSGLDKYNTKKEKKFIQEVYFKCPNLSIDYGLMEKAKNVYMLQASFGWADLGSWNSLFDFLKKDKQRNTVSKNGEKTFFNSKNNLVILNQKEKLAVIQGLNDFIIVDSQEILLICKKSEEQNIKYLLNIIQEKYGKKYL